jgi:hypothetical protein
VLEASERWPACASISTGVSARGEGGYKGRSRQAGAAEEVAAAAKAQEERINLNTTMYFTRAFVNSSSLPFQTLTVYHFGRLSTGECGTLARFLLHSCKSSPTTPTMHTIPSTTQPLENEHKALMSSATEVAHNCRVATLVACYLLN